MAIHREGCSKNHEAYGFCRDATPAEDALVRQLGRIIDKDPHALVVIMEGAKIDPEDGTISAYVATGPMLERRFSVVVKELG